MTRTVILSLLTTGILLASAPAHASPPDGAVDPDLPGEQFHVLSVEHTSSSGLSAVVAVPVRFYGTELTSDNFGLSSTYAEGHTLHPATDVAHLPPDTLELLLLRDDSSTVSDEILFAQRTAVVELVRHMEPGVSFLVASTTRGVVSPATADAAEALHVLADFHATTAPMDLALLSATTPAITPPIRCAALAFDHEVDHVPLVAQTLRNESAQSVPTFIVVLDGAPFSDTSQGSITVIAAPSNRLVAISDRVSSAPSAAAPIAETIDGDVVAAASRPPASAPARLDAATVGQIELKTQIWDLRSWWLFAALLLVAALSSSVVGPLRSSAGAIPIGALNTTLRRSGDRDVQVSPPTGRTTILVPARAGEVPDAPPYDEDA